MPRKKKETAQSSLEETKQGLALFYGKPAGQSIMEYQPPARVVVRDEAGNYHEGKTEGGVLFRVAFRSVLAQLKGPPLSVFMCISLHFDVGSASYPNINTICKLTGYEKQTVMRAIQYLESIPGLLEVTRKRGTSNIYRSNYAVYEPNNVM